ncbi:MAG: DUF1573 domain-containing protein [candidate division Zixibacteria bacterium]|nr:DUF1573 domain-containing protein [candidate division Zixibacteria bacterium]
MSSRRNKIRTNRRRRKKRNQKDMSYLMIFGGVLIIVVGLIVSLVGGSKPAEAQINYQAEDIVNDSPFVAVHEMGAPTISDINFLPKDGPQPEIAVSSISHDFGSIGPTEIAKQSFIIANHGDAPLTIHRAYTTCGCTTAEFSSSVIPPGKVVEMTIVLDAGFHDLRGQTVRRGVIIENNDPDNSQIEIWTQAKVRNEP